MPQPASSGRSVHPCNGRGQVETKMNEKVEVKSSERKRKKKILRLMMQNVLTRLLLNFFFYFFFTNANSSAAQNPGLLHPVGERGGAAVILSPVHD